MKKNSKVSNFCFLISPWFTHGKALLLGCFVTSVILSPIASFFSATLAQTVIDQIQMGYTFREAFVIGLVYLFIAFVLGLLKSLYEDLYCRWKKQEVEGKIERMIYDKALKVDYRYFNEPDFYNSYKMATDRFASQSSETVQNIFSLLNEIACFIVYGGLIAAHRVSLFLIVLLCSFFVAYAQIYWSKISVERDAAMINDRRKTDYMRRLFFNHTAVADMRSSNIKSSLFNLFDKAIQSEVSIYKKYGMQEVCIDILVSIAQLGTIFAVPVYVAWGLLSGNIESIGVYATLLTSSMALKETMNAIGWWVSQISLGITYAQQIQKFFKVDSPIETSSEGLFPEDGPFSIQLENVSYTYPDNTFSIKNLNVSIKPGMKIAIVGENGAGKTTLTKLLLRLYDADSGTVLINGHPISSYSIEALRDKIGVAFQNTMLYALTVRENMTSYANADEIQLNKNLEDVGLHLDLDAQISKEFYENGIILSGGDCQKLCLSRLMHSDFGLLILDEPSSALDPITEYNIAKLIFNNSSTTTIMIAHRLATVVDADMIYMFSNGEIIEEGTHSQLMKKNGKYREMFSKQAEGYMTK